MDVALLLEVGDLGHAGGDDLDDVGEHAVVTLVEIAAFQGVIADAEFHSLLGQGQDAVVEGVAAAVLGAVEEEVDPATVGDDDQVGVLGAGRVEVIADVAQGGVGPFEIVDVVERRARRPPGPRSG